jgi:hypothetical protein
MASPSGGTVEDVRPAIGLPPIGGVLRRQEGEDGPGDAGPRN